MKSLKKLFILSLLTILLVPISACMKDTLGDCVEHEVTPCNEDATKVNIRIHNTSDYDFCNVVMNPNHSYANYGIIKSGESTCYRSFDEAYGYGYIQLFIENDEFSMHPIDYVGEDPLNPGYYTYTIDVVDIDNRKLSQELN